jgi:hypothetical protein
VIVETVVFVVVALALLAAFVWLLREPAAQATGEDAGLVTLQRLPQIEELFPLHCRYFPQLRQVISRGDEQYMRQRASRRLQQRWRAERRQVAQQFLEGLRDDFLRLNRLAGTVASLSPRVDQRHEAERLRLALRFRLLWFLVGLRLKLGPAPLAQLTGLANLISTLAVELERGITALEEPSLARLRGRQAEFSG